MGTRRKISAETGKKSHFIAEWLEHRRMTQEQLGAEAGYATSTINQLINGKQGYSQVTLEALAPALQCEPWELIAVNPLASKAKASGEAGIKALLATIEDLPDQAINPVWRMIDGYIRDAELPSENQRHGQSEPAIRRRVSTP